MGTGASTTGWHETSQTEGLASATEGLASATIYDIARIAGVAPSTVSRALSKPGRVSFQTAERIRKVADEIGYRSTTLA